MPGSTPAITPRNSSAQTPSKRFLWFDHRNMAWMEADGALMIRVIACVQCTGAEGESLGSGLGSMALFFPQFIMSHKHTYTRTLRLLKWLSLLSIIQSTRQKCRGQDFWGNSPRRQLMWLSEVPHVSCTDFLDNSTAFFQRPDLTQITYLHNPREIQVLMNVCFPFRTRADFLTQDNLSKINHVCT